jgi:hypothetical protein
LNNSSTFAVGYPAKAIKDKTLSFLMGLVQRWDHQYRFAYLAYRSALFYASKDIGYANIWSNIALQEVSFAIEKYQQSQKTSHPLTGLQRNFYQFRTDRIKSLDWLNSDTKTRWILLGKNTPLPEGDGLNNLTQILLPSSYPPCNQLRAIRSNPLKWVDRNG